MKSFAISFCRLRTLSNERRRSRIIWCLDVCKNARPIASISITFFAFLPSGIRSTHGISRIWMSKESDMRLKMISRTRLDTLVTCPVSKLLTVSKKARSRDTQECYHDPAEIRAINFFQTSLVRSSTQWTSLRGTDFFIIFMGKKGKKV